MFNLKSWARNYWKKGEEGLVEFWNKTKQEANETIEAEKIAKRYIEGKSITEVEKKALLSQIADLLKIVFIGIPFALLPGFSVIIIVLVKIGRKLNVNFLPSAFAPSKTTGKDKAPTDLTKGAH